MVDEEDIGATTRGLVQCLRMLAEEAASLNLASTVVALREALVTCNEEIDTGTPGRIPGRRPAHSFLH